LCDFYYNYYSSSVMYGRSWESIMVTSRSG